MTPRNRLMVPMVTTMEGSPSPVTRKPLNAPHNSPTDNPMTISIGVSKPVCTAAPIAVDASAMMDATDKSISPEMINSAIAKAIIAFSVKLNVASDRFQAFRK